MQRKQKIDQSISSGEFGAMADDPDRDVILQQLGQFAEEGNIKEKEEEEQAPEDSIPDLPENQKAREFLKNAPSKGLFMPLGVQVKVMQCWRCKAYGHRTGDAECPLRDTGTYSVCDIDYPSKINLNELFQEI